VNDMEITGYEWQMALVGAIGIYLAHWIWYRKEDSEFSWDHVNALAFYWILGALAYFYVY